MARQLPEKVARLTVGPLSRQPLPRADRDFDRPNRLTWLQELARRQVSECAV